MDGIYIYGTYEYMYDFYQNNLCAKWENYKNILIGMKLLLLIGRIQISSLIGILIQPISAIFLISQLANIEVI
jgi:hypothetical protein